MRIRDKIKKPQRPVVAYEILPPREKDGTLNSYAETISSLLSQTHIDAINIPEVHDEAGRGDRGAWQPLRRGPRGSPQEQSAARQRSIPRHCVPPLAIASKSDEWRHAAVNSSVRRQYRGAAARLPAPLRRPPRSLRIGLAPKASAVTGHQLRSSAMRSAS